MKQELRIGFLPLTDCAVLVAALERGFFEKYGLHVTLQREVSWANIRDRVAFGELDAAHMLPPCLWRRPLVLTAPSPCKPPSVLA